MSEAMTRFGKLALFRNSFLNLSELPKFGYLGVGIGNSDFTDESTQLSSECTPTTHTGYSRVLTNNTLDEENCMLTLEGVLSTANIAVDEPGVDIREVGITNTNTLGEGTWICLGEIPPMKKNKNVQLRYVVNIILE